MSESLRDFALRTYRVEGVSEDLLSLQDEAGCDVTLVLWCLWLAQQGRQPGADLPSALDWSRTWGETVTRPLRAARRAAKPLAASDKGIAALRQRIQQAEIDSELVTLDRLETAAPGEPALEGFARLARSNLSAYAGVARLNASFETLISRILPAVET